MDKREAEILHVDQRVGAVTACDDHPVAVRPSFTGQRVVARIAIEQRIVRADPAVDCIIAQSPIM